MRSRVADGWLYVALLVALGCAHQATVEQCTDSRPPSPDVELARRRAAEVIGDATLDYQAKRYEAAFAKYQLAFRMTGDVDVFELMSAAAAHFSTYWAWRYLKKWLEHARLDGANRAAVERQIEALHRQWQAELNSKPRDQSGAP
jgi:hypothetical protein